MNILNGRFYIGQYNVTKDDLNHSLKFAREYAENGDVDYTIQCLEEANDYAGKLGYNIDEDLKNDIMRTAYRKGVTKKMEYARCHLNDMETVEECKNYANEYTEGILKCQRSVKEIRSSIYFAKPFDELSILLKHGSISDEMLQKEFNETGKIYDVQTLLDSKIMKQKIEDVDKMSSESKTSKIKSFFSKVGGWFKRKQK